jgi:hypothetical protein
MFNKEDKHVKNFKFELNGKVHMRCKKDWDQEKEGEWHGVANQSIEVSVGEKKWSFAREPRDRVCKCSSKEGSYIK